MSSEPRPAGAGRRPGVGVAASATPWRYVWDAAAAGPDPRRTAVDIEVAISRVLGRNTLLRDHHITATAGPHGQVTLTGAVATQALRREVELSCWTVPGVRSLRDELVVGRRPETRTPLWRRMARRRAGSTS